MHFNVQKGKMCLNGKKTIIYLQWCNCTGEVNVQKYDDFLLKYFDEFFTNKYLIVVKMCVKY